MQALSHQMEPGSVLKSITVQQLISGKGRLIEVPYTASVGDTMNALLAHNILAVPVAAPPGQWIGAGGSMILESDKCTGQVRKHYIGIVSVLDVLIHLSELYDNNDVDNLLTAPVSTIIGHCIEGLSLWTISPHTSLYDALEPMSQGMHRTLVPIESQMEHITGIELTEASPGYRMLTQTDIIRILLAHSADIQLIVTRTVESLGAVQSSVFGVPADMSLTETLKCMTTGSLTAVAIVDPLPWSNAPPELAVVRGRKLVGTFSASDLRGCSSEALRQWSSLGVLEFVRRSHVAGKSGFGGIVTESKTVGLTDAASEAVRLGVVTCLPSSSLGEVMSKAVDCNVHRVWVTDDQGCLLGVVTMSDMLRVVRQSLRLTEKSPVQQT